MKTKYNLIQLLGFAIIGFAFLALYLRNCNPQPEVEITKDTTKISKKNYTPVPVAYISHIKTSAPIAEGEQPPQIIRDTTFIHDTIWAYNDYLSTRVYKDTLLDDSSGFVFVLDTVTLNKIVSRSYDINLINTTKIIQDKRGMFSVGVGTAINLLNDSLARNSLNANFYFNKGKSSYGIGVNTNKEILFNWIYNFNKRN